MSFANGILTGKSAIVTGGATGIGSFIVRKLGALGANVGIVSRKEENLVSAVNEFKDSENVTFRVSVIPNIADIQTDLIH